MIEISEDPNYNPRNLTPPRTSVWSVYRRLLGYALRYKGRLAVSILFALLVAGSFTSMIVGVAAVVDVSLSPPEPLGNTGAAKETIEQAEARATDQLTEKYAPRVVSALKPLEFAHGMDEIALRQGVHDVIAGMRARPMYAIEVACFLLVGLSLVAGIARFLQEYLAGTIGANISVELGQEMYANIMRLSLGFFEKHPTGELIARFANDIFQVNRGLSGVFVKLMREPFKAVFFMITAFTIDPLMTLIGLCVLPPVAAAIYQLGRKFKKSVRRSLEKVASMAMVASETFNGIAIVKGFCMEAYEIARTNAEFAKLRRYLVKMVKVDAAVGPVVEFVLILGVAALVLFAGARVMSQEMSQGDVAGLIFAFALMLDPLRKLSTVNNQIQTSVASAERVFEFIDMQPEIVEKAGARALPRLSNSIRFENIHFAYKRGTEVLRGIDLEVKRGEMVALVGFSGAGKSTLVKLLPRFYDVTEGAVKIDGVDIRDVSFTSLRDQISIVTQETILFNESVRDNIAFGRKDYTAGQVLAAARAAYADGFIDALPEGYDTVIGESGATLSGGQRQRLAIARAIIKDPAILILDEATSNLDSESERAIQKALAAFVEGRTTIVIAHRLATVQRAHRIVVMDEGRIAELGTHQELLANGGIYRRLYEQQLLSGGEDTA
ncbi:MAG TPA: ABC transporter ATP-binding protein [Candidatus Hydrogenedentes bacterium]|nr:ABC transporter ATP-binding protein [Candidatus Hydrogenedentota bacterium]HQE81791.1 ABC transporter ATP-binding protein [Candidatus Hydrogenedentota bacterium]HQH54055.1 ABC transporter ATP-binding protein [Candidatus Hydrogenedentota bacterium]HQM51215.1 ABC transporter ATP-binding protein [Candidatus Hydrogenedentota bacterium]